MTRKYNLNHRLIACVLLISLFLQSCGNFSNQVIPTIEEEKTNDTPGSTKKTEIIKQLVEQKLTAAGWEVKDLYEEQGELKVKAIERHGNFTSKPHELSVTIAKDIDLEQASLLSSEGQKRLVHFNSPQNNQPGRMLVAKGGILGGMRKRKREKEKEKEKEKEGKDDSKGKNLEKRYKYEASEQDEPDTIEEEKDVHYFPRCEYYTRYGGTSHFAMDDCEYWATYFRSTGFGGESGRYTRKDIANKTFKNLNLNIEEGRSYNSRTGTFYNPYKHEKYTMAVTKSRENFLAQNKTQQLNSGILLYEELLDYRNQICSEVRNYFDDNTKNIKERFDIIHHNEYPCLLVKIPFVQNFKTNIDKESWNQLFIAYYVAIVNKKATEEGIPIEMIIRSSFGHLLPSIDVTGNSFRINVGIVPACYGRILAQSLVFLQDIIPKVLNSTLNQALDINEVNNKIKDYNKQKSNDKSLPEWDTKQSCQEILNL